MKILAIDCAASLCAACIYDATEDRELGRSVLDLGKGHAEHLMKVVDEAIAQSRAAFADLDAIAVSIGPGSFTGVRVGVSAARGYALALKIPAIGVNTLEALAAASRIEHPNRAVFAALSSAKDDLQAALYDSTGAILEAPAIIGMERAVELARHHRPVLAGTAAEKIAESAGGGFEIGTLAATVDIAIYARLAAAKGGSSEKPAPLYLREPDAKPQAGFVLPREQG
ncbi:tRNA (adenosine(37)-N6)-threonylcarbamoyltransferase complex dimerization subunit type 1 TsaB [Mesorhizobium sp. SB112]|uniref:tRNA (adenosine(37)-N6)-threonylcarbamoyltransferase complex dimerization subunit type 1 TsaB n=1 Tax=Mesorhizobium sp. SB112 TaxID=3151853 RepID=UPI0032658017